MSVNQTLDLVAQTIAILVGLSVLVGGMIVALKRWIKRTVGEPLMEQMVPNGGRKETTRRLVEELVDKTGQILDRVHELEVGRKANATRIEQALDKANAALTIARETGERLDRHMDRQEKSNG